MSGGMPLVLIVMTDENTTSGVSGETPRRASQAKPPRRPKSKFSRMWVPNQPGAWVMVLTPAIAGTIAGGVSWRSVWTTVAWLACYCAQFTTARWMVSHGQRRYMVPALSYMAATCVIGLPLLVLTPQLLWWAPFYILVAAASFGLAWMRHDRGLLSQTVAVIAAGGIGAVTTGLGTRHFPDGMFSSAGMMIGAIFAVFEFGQLLFVPSMAVGRAGRGNRDGQDRAPVPRGYYAASVAVSVAMAVAGFALIPAYGPAPAVAALILLARATVLPVLSSRGVVPPLAAAPCEVVTSLVMLIAVAVSF